MKIKADPRVQEKFDQYPTHVQPRLQALRTLVLAAAEDVKGLDQLEETLKWGEPSYLTRHGSTLRMDWKAKFPGQVALYFQCTSRLVPTFRTLYADELTFEGSRAVVLDLESPLPEAALKHCISLALTYHKVKDLPLLGA